MDGKYNIGTDHIRALAIECHALDLQFDRLFNAESICGYSDRIYQTYNRLLSTTLLNLAISIRVSLNAEPEYEQRDTGIENCGLFEDGGPHGDGSFSIKDVCDKLIHADQIFKPIEPGVEGACCTLLGSYHKKQWELGLGVQILSEYVLKWLDELDERAEVDKIVQELARYSAALTRSLDETTHANDRSTYRDHLATAASWLGMIHTGASLSELRESVASEKRKFGWGYLSGESGASASAAFERFVSFLDSQAQ